MKKDRYYRSLNYLIGQVLKILPGADPEIIKEIILEKVKESERSEHES